ncbi:MAG: penicillin acylase family protein [Sedimentisphaerales bacterium]|nr:penicillin acylase family protein [Sedimentisphaerales bacterium]
MGSRESGISCAGWVLCVLTLLGCQGRAETSDVSPSRNAAGQYGQVELLRDRWGVPHVFAETDAGAMYGLGYATAQDRAFQMYYNLRIIQGRLAEVVGDVKVGVTRQQPQGTNSALRSDIQMRTIGYYRAAQETADRLDPEARALLEAYSQGVNDYIHNHPNDLLHLFERYSLRPERWTPADCIASWWRMGLFFSGDGLREMIPYYEIKDGTRVVHSFAPDDLDGVRRAMSASGLFARDDASVIQRSDVTDEWVERVYEYAAQHGLTRKVDVTRSVQRVPAGPRFSHAWVVGKTRTTDGSAVLVSDPQTLVRNPSLFYEYHISGATFNARGIGVAGSPNLLIGFTPHVAWGLTALGADQADLFLLKTDPNRPNQYLLDGRWRDMDMRTETIQVKGGRAETLTVRETQWGPVVTSIAMGVRRGDEVALKRIPICEPEHDTFTGALAMLHAKDVYEFQQASGGWRFPSANCVFGDSQGNIGYRTILALPIRSANSLLDERAAHEGWDSANDWQGILPHELLAQVINPAQGWLVSANHRPITSFYPISMGISTGSLGDTDRSWRLKERVTARETFTPADVLDIHYDTVAPVKRDLVRLGYHLRDVQKYRLEEDTLLALDYLEDWRAADSKSEMSIKGTEILNLMPMAFRQNFAAATIYGGGVSGLCNMLQTLDTRLAAEPNAALTDEEAEYVNLMLRAAWRYGKANYGDDPNLWNERARQQLLEKPMPYMSTLDGFGSLDEASDITFPSLTCLDGGTILSQRAQSYTQFVTMANADSSTALLPVGLSERPESPSRPSNYDLWSQGKLRPAPLSREQVDAIAVSRDELRPIER